MKTYIGSKPNDRAHGRRVWVVENGESTPLRHIMRHSPTGLAWGYGGSGPADLARSILADVLGDAAKCRDCNGTFRLVWEEADGDFRPPLHTAEIERLEASGAMGSDYLIPCYACDGGIAFLPYQRFKADVIAALPFEEGFELEEAVVLHWLTVNGGERYAVIATERLRVSS